jgi:hypothetical protein
MPEMWDAYAFIVTSPSSSSSPARQIHVENVEIVFKDDVGYDSQKLLESVKGRRGEY